MTLGKRNSRDAGPPGPPPQVSLLIRGIGPNTGIGELRSIFEKYGQVKDVYIPMDFHTRVPKPFAFVEFFDGRDARDAKEALDHSEIDGRQVGVLFARKGRTQPTEMRAREGGVDPDRADAIRRGRSGSPRRRSRSRSGGRGGRSRSRSGGRRRSPPPRDSPPRRFISQALPLDSTYRPPLHVTCGGL